MFRKWVTTGLFLLAGLLSAEEYRFSAADLDSRLDSPNIIFSTILNHSGRHTGISFLEVLPLMEEVYRMELADAHGRQVFEADDIAEFWSESWLIPNGDTLDILYRGELYPDLQELRFSGTPVDSRELEIWLSWEGVDELKAELERFARFHQLELRAVEVPSPDSKLVAVVRARGDVPDVVMIQSSAVDRLVRNRAVQSLDYLELPELNPSGLEAFTLDGHLMAVPFYFDTQLFLYNPDLVSPPAGGMSSLSDLEAMARSVRGNDTHPMVWNAYSSNWLIPFQVSFGKDHLLENDGTIIIDDEPTSKALSYIVDLQDRRLLVPMERDAMDALFISGRVGLIMTGSYSIPHYESLGISLGVLPFPVNDATGKAVSPLLDYKAFCISRQTHSPVLARRVIQYLAGSGVQQRFCPELAKLPARSEVMEIPELDFRHLSVLQNAAESGFVMPPRQIYSIYKNNMWKLLRFALSHRLTVEQTLEEGQRLMDNSIDN